jgi:hypothetical protein
MLHKMFPLLIAHCIDYGHAKKKFIWKVVYIMDLKCFLKYGFETIFVPILKILFIVLLKWLFNNHKFIWKVIAYSSFVIVSFLFIFIFYSLLFACDEPPTVTILGNHIDPFLGGLINIFYKYSLQHNLQNACWVVQ